MKEIKPAKSLDWINRKTDQEVFTDRETCKEKFYEGYEAAKNGDTFTLYFYGIGGYGKTTLLDYLKNDVQNKDTYVVKYDSQDGCDKVKILAALWKGLKDQTNDKFIFSFFEPVLYLYESITQNNYSNVRFSEKSNLTSDVTSHSVDFVGQIMSDFNILLSPYLPRAYNAIHDIGKIINAIIESYKRKKEFKFDSKVYEIFSKCVDKKSIEDNIGHLFAFDIKYNVSKLNCKPIIFMIDTIERMVDEKYSVGSTISIIDKEYSDSNRLIKNNWLFGDDGLIRMIEGVYWVLAGRNSIFNEEDKHVYSFEMNSFSEDYAKSYLEKNGINDLNIHRTIIKASHGVPVYLSICVGIYLRKTKQNIKVLPEDFELIDCDELTKRYCEWLNKDELKILRIMSLMKTFSDDDFKKVYIEIESEKEYYESENSYRNIINSTNLYRDEASNVYKMNDIVSKGVINDTNFNADLKHMYLDNLFNVFYFDDEKYFKFEELDEDTYFDVLDRHRTIYNNLLLCILNDDKYLEKFINKCVNYFSGIFSATHQDYTFTIYHSGDALSLILWLCDNKKYEIALPLFDLFFVKEDFTQHSIPSTYFKYYKLDIKYLRSLNITKNYSKLKEKSYEIYNYLLECQKNGFVQLTDKEFFIRRNYYTKALYHLGEYEDALNASSIDLTECEKLFKKDKKVYIYNKLLNSLCLYKNNRNNEAFSRFNEIADKYDDLFDIIDPDIKDNFLNNYYKYIQK